MSDSATKGGEAANIKLEENPYVQELLGILKDNGKDAAGLMAIFDHIKGMENFVKAAENQIVDMKTQLNDMKEIQNHPIKSALQNTIKALETKVAEIKTHIAELKANVVEGCKNAVAAFRQKGLSALNKLSSFFNLKPSLQAIDKHCENTIKRCESNIVKIETFSREYHQAGRALKNMARMLIGREPIDAPAEIGKLAKAMCAPHRAEKACMESIRNAADKAMGRLENLEASTEAVNDVNNTTKSVDKKPEAKKSAAKKPSLMGKLAENKEKIRLLDLEKSAAAAERLPKVAGAEL
jgi:regulator of replication initiation timing